MHDLHFRIVYMQLILFPWPALPWELQFHSRFNLSTFHIIFLTTSHTILSLKSITIYFHKCLIMTYYHNMAPTFQACVPSSSFCIISNTVDVYPGDDVVRFFIFTEGLCLFTGIWIITDSVAIFPIYSIPSLPFDICEASPHEVLAWTLFSPLVETFGYEVVSCNVYPCTLEWHRRIVSRHYLTKNDGCRSLTHNQFTGPLPTSLSALTNAQYMCVPNEYSGIPYDSILDHSIVCLPTMQRLFAKHIQRATRCVARATHEPSTLVRKQGQCAWVWFHVHGRESTSLGHYFVQYGKHDNMVWGHFTSMFNDLMPI